MPISALTIAQSAPLVYLVFSHTRMRGPDLDATAATLVFFSLGMFAWGAQNILARGFYATRNTLTPAIVGTAITFRICRCTGCWCGAEQHLGLALASSLAITVYTLVAVFPPKPPHAQPRGRRHVAVLREGLRSFGGCRRGSATGSNSRSSRTSPGTP